MKSILRCASLLERSSQTILIRCSSTQTQALKSIDEMPGPLRLPLIGNLWQLLPIIGKYDLLRMDVMFDDYYKKYGPIVREKIANIDAVHFFEPEHFETLTRLTNPLPLRFGFFAVKRYRESNPDLYGGPGILPINDKRWWKLRQAFQKPISPLKETRDFLEPTDEITEEFVRSIKPGQTIHDFMTLANRLNMELVCMMLFNERINCFNDEALKPDSYLTNLIHQVVEFAEGIGEQDRAEMGIAYFKNKNYRQMEATQHLVEEFATKMLNKVKEKGDPEDKCVMAQFLRNPDIPDSELMAAMVDLLLGGIHTTAITTSFLLYHLGTLPDVQSKLKEEARRLLPTSDTKITKDILNEAVYCRAAMKEVFRLNPIAIAQGRWLAEDLNIAGYKIPKNTMVICHSLASSKLERYFKDALKFKPERWIKGSPEYEHPHPYLVIPFGLGLRSCIARRRAEQNLLVFMLRMFRDNKVHWMGKETLGFTTPFMISPDGPVSVMFTPDDN